MGYDSYMHSQNWIACCCGYSTHVLVSNHFHIATASPRSAPAAQRITGESCRKMAVVCCMNVPVLKDPVVYSRAGVCTVAHYQHGMVEVGLAARVVTVYSTGVVLKLYA